MASSPESARTWNSALVLPPINHPARVAERAATLDILSDGRLEFGTGRSATWTELAGCLRPMIDRLPSDYRDAVAYYAGATQEVVRGGDHTLTSFPEHIPEIVEWAAQ